MADDGKQLEILVRQVEELLLPQGFTVTGRNQVFNDEGVQIAEFDIEIRGRLGSTDIVWLIECRDRSEAGPGSWIEQLVGRRDRFGFNKVTAVSTSGFAPGATQYAREAGIELRTVQEISANDVSSWLGVRALTVRNKLHKLTGVFLQYTDGESRDRISALRRAVEAGTTAAGGKSGEARILRANDRGHVATATEAFVTAVDNHGSFFADIVPNGPATSVNLKASYPDDLSHFVVDTDAGPVRIREIRFQGELSILESEVPHGAVKEYRGEGEGKHISQSVAFPLEVQGKPFEVEMHNLGETGETILLLRKTGKKPQ